MQKFLFVSLAVMFLCIFSCKSGKTDNNTGKDTQDSLQTNFDTLKAEETADIMNSRLFHENTTDLNGGKSSGEFERAIKELYDNEFKRTNDPNDPFYLTTSSLNNVGTVLKKKSPGGLVNNLESCFLNSENEIDTPALAKAERLLVKIQDTTTIKKFSYLMKDKKNVFLQGVLGLFGGKFSGDFNQADSIVLENITWRRIDLKLSPFKIYLDSNTNRSVINYKNDVYSSDNCFLSSVIEIFGLKGSVYATQEKKLSADLTKQSVQSSVTTALNSGSAQTDSLSVRTEHNKNNKFSIEVNGHFYLIGIGSKKKDLGN